MPHAIYPVDPAASQVLHAIEDRAFLFECLADLMTEAATAIRSRHNHEIIAADMPHKVIRVAIFARDTLANAANQPDNIVAGQKSIHIIEGFEVIQVNIEDAPGFRGTEFLFDS